MKRCEGGSSKDETRKTVRAAYGRIASESGSCCGPGGTCCGSASPEDLARGIGYGESELEGLPDGANLGLSCGNPTALASLRNGETVVDLGAGAGFDAFIAARKVGGKGRVIGIDMTPEMVERARANARSFARKGYGNVEFRLGEIENLPAADCTADVIISNCVINLSPDKARVWREAFRVLKAGGRIAVSDLALIRRLPPAVRRSAEALTGCIAGAVLVDRTKRMLEEAGFREISLESQPGKIDAMAEWSDSFYRNVKKLLPRGRKMSDYVTSLRISARKPARKPSA